MFSERFSLYKSWCCRANYNKFAVNYNKFAVNYNKFAVDYT